MLRLPLACWRGVPAAARRPAALARTRALSASPSAAADGGRAPEAVRPPLPPFTEESARLKVQLAEDAWNSRDPARVALAYSEDSEWRNRAQFIVGRQEIRQFLAAKWVREQNYRLRKYLWAFRDNRIAVCFEYEYCTEDGQWYRAYGNENWEFDERCACACAGPPRRRRARRA